MDAAPLYSIGYGTRSEEDFVALLQRYRVQYLVDVRSRPYSRYRPMFSKNALQAIINGAQMRYVFLGHALGGMPDDPACRDADGRVDYARVQQQPWFIEALDRLIAGMNDGHCMALMCAEADPERCHRTRLIGQALADRGVSLMHIDRDGELVAQQQVMDRITQGQGMLFDDGSV